MDLYCCRSTQICHFIRVFEFGVEEKTDDPHGRLYNLTQDI